MGPRTCGLSLAVLVAVSRLVLAAGDAPTPALPQGEPLAVEASAIIPLDVESAVSIVGIQGQITVSTRDERELRVVSRLLGAEGAEIPVGVWQDGSKLIVAPARGQAPGPRVLRVEVPKNFAVAIDASKSDVFVESVAGSVDLNGTDLRASIHSCSGPVDVDLSGGSLSVTECSGATLRLRNTSAKVNTMSGDVSVHATGKDVTLHDVRGTAEVDTDGVGLVVSGGDGGFRIKANQGSVGVKSAGDGGDIELSGAALLLEDCKGDITVTTDASVSFSSMAASLHLDMYGGMLRGKGNQGILEVRTRNTEINVESIEQGMRVQGDGLKARIVDVGGELYVEASVSDVVIDRATAVDVRIDRGSVTVQRTGGPVKATVVGGDAHIVDGIGTVQLELDGGDAEVSWASITGDKESKLINKSGAITVRFPVGASCRVEARSKYGRVESNLQGVKVLDDMMEAQGSVHGGFRPLISVAAYGDIHLLDGSTPPDEN